MEYLGFIVASYASVIIALLGYAAFLVINFKRNIKILSDIYSREEKNK